MKNLITILYFILGSAVLVVLTWSFLYAVNGNIKDGTDKIFKWGDYKVEQTDKQNSDSPTAQITFENDFAKIILG